MTAPRRAVPTPALWAAAAAALAFALGWWLQPPPTRPAPPATATALMPAAPPRAAPPGMAPAAPAAAPAPPVPLPPPATAAAAGPRLDPETLALRPAGRPMFRADGQGRLVHDEHTRLQVERLLALHEPGEARRLAEAEAEAAGLPAAAAAQARELVERFEAFQLAQRQTFAPGVAPQVPEEGLAQLQALQAMRASHFGAEAAQAMFGRDDAVTRRLLELMQQETDTRLSMEARAMRAQARYDQEQAAGGRR